MLIEVYGSQKPAVSYRAWLSSALLLAAACVPAVVMISGEPKDALAAPESPPNWEISFRPPHRFQPGDRVLTRLGEAYPFHGLAQRDAQVTLAVLRVEEVVDEHPRRICAAILQEHNAMRPFAASAAVAQSSAEKIGSVEGFQLIGAQGQTVVRAVVLSEGVAYAIFMHVEGGRLDPHLYRLFERTCLSVEYLAGRVTPGA